MSKAYSIVQIGDIIQTKNDKSKQLQTSDYLSNGMLPIVDQGADLVCGYTNDLSKMYDKGLPVIIFGDHTLHTKYVDFDFAIGADGTQLVGPKNNDCDIKYLYYLISRAAKLIGSEGYKRHFRVLKEFETEYINSFPEQQKIATILSSVDNVIGKTRAQIDKLKDLKTGMMQELLTKGIGHTEFKDSPVGRIPKSWQLCLLEDVAKIQTGVAKNSKLAGDMIEVPYLRVANVQDGYLDLTEVKTLQLEQSRLERFMLQDEDVLVNEGGDFDKLGRGFIWRNQISPCVHQNHVFVVRTNQKKLLPMFFNYLSGSQHGKQYYLGCAKQTTNLASLNSSQLRKFPVVLPLIEEQKKICEIIGSIDTNLEEIERNYALLEFKKKALMQDLLLGWVTTSRVMIE